MLGIICIHAASLTMAFHARPAKYLHLVHAEQRQRRSPTSKTQLKLLNSLNCSRHQHDGTTADVCRHQCDFQDILIINCIICIICIYCIMCTCTGRIHPSRRFVLLFANNSYHTWCQMQSSTGFLSMPLCLEVNCYWNHGTTEKWTGISSWTFTTSNQWP